MMDNSNWGLNPQLLELKTDALLPESLEPVITVTIKPIVSYII